MSAAITMNTVWMRRVATLLMAPLLTIVGAEVRSDDKPPGAGTNRSDAELELLSLVHVTSEHENVKPFVVARPRGGVYVAWAQKNGDRTAILLARSADGEKFDPPVRLSPDGMDLDLGAENGPNVAVGPKGEIYVVWAAGWWAASKTKSPSDQSTKKSNAPKSNASHAGHSGHGGAPQRPANLNIWLAKSSDDGGTFSNPLKVNDDLGGAEHRFPTVAVDERGNVIVAWLDKRKSSSERPNYCRVFISKSTDGGATFSRNVDATELQANSICHCCRIALAVHPTRGVFAAFRNDIDDLRDMFLVRSSDGAAPFSKPAAMEDTGWYVPT